MEDGVRGVDVLMMLRIQMERQDKGFFPSTEEYSKNWCLTTDRLSLAKERRYCDAPGADEPWDRNRL